MVVLFTLLFPNSSSRAAEFPDAFFAEYCFECHDDITQKAEIRLDDAIDRDWSEKESLAFFERVHAVIDSGEMPPEKETHRPSDNERAELAEWLHNELMTHSKVGGTVLRRLNRIEYENTIQKIFGFFYRVPPEYPTDPFVHGFDNLGEGLVLSPPLMEAYVQAATEVADTLFPPPRKPVDSTRSTVVPEDLSISYSSGAVVDGALRLASKSDPAFRSSTWPSKYEAEGSGVYRLKVDASAIGATEGEPFLLQVRAKPVSGDDGDPVSKMRTLAEFEVQSEKTETFEVEIELYRGETPLFYFANAPLDSDRSDKEELASYLEKRFRDDPRLMAAWMAIEHNSGLRGGLGWSRVKEKLADPELDVSKADLESEAGKKLIKTMTGNPVLYVETIIYDHFENGPALAIRDVEIEGPFGTVVDDEQRERRRLQAKFFGNDGEMVERGELDGVFENFLTAAFRRPADPADVAAYCRLALDHVDAGHTMDEGIHLAIRTALISPQFLYRESAPGLLDAWGLASRLSYFLHSRPPDAKLLGIAGKGELSGADELGKQAERLMREGGIDTFVERFTSQWLGTHLLEDIMPDPRLLNFNNVDRRDLIDETETFFSTILRENLPIETFIDPDFTFMTKNSAKDFYGMKSVKSNKLERVSLPADSPYGGILGQASVMMATANGVDTQPVLRGVWILENVLGDPPPPPPTNVPAITPDTRGAKTVRDLLEAHRADESCARCHVKIDPLGYVLENFDPVGRWRDHYPLYDAKGKAKNGAKIDASGAMPDGKQFQHVNDLKKYIVENLDQFGECLSEKLMMYATGRILTYADREAIKPIVAENIESGGGFRDLLVALIRSEVFRTK